MKKMARVKRLELALFSDSFVPQSLSHPTSLVITFTIYAANGLCARFGHSMVLSLFPPNRSLPAFFHVNGHVQIPNVSFYLRIESS